MKLVTRMLVGACASAALLAPTAVVAHAAPVQGAAQEAKAPAKRFKAVQTLEKAKLEVCKAETRNKKGWKVYGRLNASKVKLKGARFTGMLLVEKAGAEAPVKRWDSAVTKKGKISKVGAVTVPKKGGYSLSGGIGAGNYGDGGPIKLAKVRKC